MHYLVKSKVETKLDNTLGLFLSMPGYEKSATDFVNGRRSVIILMDGAELYAVLEQRINLDKIIKVKKRYAAQTGDVYHSDFRIPECK